MGSAKATVCMNKMGLENAMTQNKAGNGKNENAEFVSVFSFQVLFTHQTKNGRLHKYTPL